MTTPFGGSPIAHPNRKHVETYVGRVEDQTTDVAQLISMIRTGWSTERAPKPSGVIQLTLQNDKIVIGCILIESLARVTNGISQFILTRWDEQIFRWYLVQIITDDHLIVEVWENPPDPYHINPPRIFA